MVWSGDFLDKIICGDALNELKKLSDESIHCCITSPPYWNLRDYKTQGQIGLEKTPGEYVGKLVTVFREVKRVLRDDGVCFINIGDSFFGGGGAHKPEHKNPGLSKSSERDGVPYVRPYDTSGKVPKGYPLCGSIWSRPCQLKRKDLVGIPWRVAFALQADGWYLRSDIIWAKPNPMPESVKDRPTRSHEYIFLMSKNARYYYDAEAIKEPMADVTFWRLTQPGFDQQTGGPKDPGTGNRSHRKTLNNQREKLIKHEKWKSRFEGYEEWKKTNTGRNRRSVWTIATHPYAEAHFATFPPDLIEPCIKAGCPAGGVVLDPFFGAGTTGLVAMRLGRRFVGIDLNPAYCEMARKRIYGQLYLSQQGRSL